MFQIDIYTIFLNYAIINTVNLFLIGLLYLQVRKQFPGSLTILLSYVMSTSGNLLLFFRNSLPEEISIIMGSTLVVSSTVVLLIGFEQFVHKKGIHIQNYLLIVMFFLVQAYFTFIKPDLKIRGFNLSIYYVLISSQIAWLMLIRVPASMRKITQGVGFVFCTLLIVQIVHIIIMISAKYQAIHYFDLYNYEGFFIVSYEVILIMLTYSISLMYNKYFINDVLDRDREITKLFTQKLQLELDLKDKEVIQKELNIASMKEVNENILKELKDNLDNFSEIENTNIYKMIRTFENSSREIKIWEEFDARFKEVNSSFYMKLRAKYQTLSNNEIRVTCLLHENYNTKEIALILKRSPKTIENIRGLIRKKMNLHKDDNLTLFLHSIN